MRRDVVTVTALREVVNDWRGGRRYRFPICCQAHYYLDVFRGRTPAARRGGVAFGPRNIYVPCVICARRPWRWQRPMTLDGPAESPRYATWEQSCAKLGIPADEARRYLR